MDSRKYAWALYINDLIFEGRIINVCGFYVKVCTEREKNNEPVHNF